MTKIIALIIAACAVILLLIGGRDLARVASVAVHPDPDKVTAAEDLHFYNCDVQNDGNDKNDYNFGPDAFGEVDNYAELYGELLDRLDNKGTGDSKLPDPCLMAAVAFAMDDRLGTDFLARERAQHTLPGKIVNAAAENLTNEPEYRAEMLENIKGVLESADEITIEEIGSYTSTMWMVPNRDPVKTYAEMRPTIAVENSYHNGGHALVIKYNGNVLRLRLECGYQPMDIDWPTPSDPPGTTPPPPSTTTPNPPPPSETVTTTLAPKNTAEAVPVASDPNNGGSKGGEADRTPTPEPTWPTTTTQTKAPEKTTPPVTEAPAPTTQPQPSTQAPAPTTTKHNDKDYVVDQGTSMAPQKDVAGDTPDDAIVKSDPIVQETAPPGGGDFASRY